MTLSQPQSTDKGGVKVAKPRPDVYTVLLGIALAAILLGILCLSLELSRYNWDYKAAAVRVSQAPTLKAPHLFAERT
jgi:hypothetical protein